MQVGVRTISLALALLATAAPVRAGVSGLSAIDRRELSYTFSFFSDVDGFDVFTHYSDGGVDLDNGVQVRAQWVHDVVVFPGIDAPPGSQEAVDAITTASRPIASGSDPYEDFVKSRNSIDGSLSYGGASAGYYVSNESDYFAQMVSAGYNRDFFQDNLNLAAGASYSWDRIEPLADEDTPGTADFRRTWHWNLVATQVVTPKTVVRVGGELNRVVGLQHAPYRNVYVAGTNIPERHPDERSRRAAFVRVSRYIDNLSSVKLDYRFYDDDWGVTSHTYGAKLNQYVTDEFIVRYRYRYYTQLPAYFFREEYTQAAGVDGYQTGDYRLGDFGAHLFGGRVAWRPYRVLGRIGFPERAQLVFGYERYFNSNNFSANVFETGLRITF